MPKKKLFHSKKSSWGIHSYSLNLPQVPAKHIFLQSGSNLCLLSISGHREVILIYFIFMARGIYSYLHPCFFIPALKISMVVVDPGADDL